MSTVLSKNQLRVCYMGISSPGFSRNRVYIPALKEQGVQVLECFTQSGGLVKFVSLFKKHWSMRNGYDLLVVAYPGHSIVWFARILSRKPVVFDALCTAWEAEALSHEAKFLRQLRIKFIDWVAVHCATCVLVESEEQKKFFIRRFGGNSEKYQVVYTGVDESIFFVDKKIKKLACYTAVFRGRLSYESGIEYVVRAAKILENNNIFIRIVGYGNNLSLVRKIISELNVKNIEVISQELSFSELKRKMAECHVSIGQLSKNDRLKRTIPHKAFESFALGLPYITARAEGINEIIKGGESCVMIPAEDAEALAEAIVSLRDDPDYADSLQKRAADIFENKLSQRAIGKKLVQIFSNYL